MPLLASPLDEISAHYDVVIVGSGYGGGVAAARLGGATKADGSPLRVCVLERGEEHPLGSFSESVLDGQGSARLDRDRPDRGGPDPLVNVHLGDTVSIVHGHALGGTSLINANVSIAPSPKVWEKDCWPEALQDDVAEGLQEGFDRALHMLDPRPWPDSAEHPPLGKFQALARSARHLDKPVFQPPINVNFAEGKRSAGGVSQPACNGCGDCVAGCNTGAKNTVAATYLPLAHQRGVRMFTGARVRSVERRGDGWLVWYAPATKAWARFGAPERFVRADHVILAGGTLGSTEILLRSEERGLELSPALGTRFSGNGNAIGSAYNGEHVVNGIGRGSEVTPETMVGACITGVLDARGGVPLEDGVIIEEGSLPRVLGVPYHRALNLIAPLTGDDTDDGFWDELNEAVRTAKANVTAPWAQGNATQHSQAFLVMSHDKADGRIVMSNDKARVVWPNASQSVPHDRIDPLIRGASEALGAAATPSPLSHLARRKEITVHPLGGCPMGDDPQTAVVDERGRVWAGVQGQRHDGLRVVDGSTIPCALGANPLLTITALAERSIQKLIEEQQWQAIPAEAPAQPSDRDSRRPAAGPSRLVFTERMVGRAAAGEDRDYAAGFENGALCDAVFTIHAHDVDTFLDDQQAGAALSGTVQISALSDEVFVVEQGTFHLLVDQDPAGRTKRMFYRAPLVGTDGRRLFFHGHKVVVDDPGFDPWADTTTLYVAVHEGRSDEGPVVARGRIHIEVDNFRIQLAHTRAYAVDGSLDLGAVARFAGAFAGGLWDVYGPGDGASA